MPRPTRPQRDLSAQAGNPTSVMQQHYQDLMSIQDPDELIEAADQLVRPLVGHGFSQLNYKKFLMNMQQAARRGATGVQSFLSNYILKGSGLGVSESNEVDAIASLICEDTNSVKLTKRQIALKRLVESAGFKVTLLEAKMGRFDTGYDVTLPNGEAYVEVTLEYEANPYVPKTFDSPEEGGDINVYDGKITKIEPYTGSLDQTLIHAVNADLQAKMTSGYFSEDISQHLGELEDNDLQDRSDAQDRDW